MNRFKLTTLAVFISCFASGQNVGIGTSTPDASAALDIESTEGGMLIPRMTTTERNAISSPATGLMIFNSTVGEFESYNGTEWASLVPVSEQSKWTNDAGNGLVQLSNESDGTTARLNWNSVNVTDAGYLSLGNTSPSNHFQISDVIGLNHENSKRYSNFIMNPEYNANTRQFVMRVDGYLNEVYHVSFPRTVTGARGANGTYFMRYSLDAPAKSFYMNSLGDLALGTNPNSAYQLLVNGDMRANGNVYSNSTVLTSDVRLKSDIVDLTNALNIIQELRPVHYTKEAPYTDVPSREEFGFIAQEVREFMPELVFGEESDSTYLSLDYNSFIAILTKASQEQTAIINNQQSEIELLKNRLDRLEGGQVQTAGVFSATIFEIALGVLLVVLVFRARRKIARMHTEI